MNHPLRDMCVGLLVPTILLLCVVGYDLARRGLHRSPRDEDWPVTQSDIEQGRILTVRYGCGACHVIPRLPDAVGRVGPKLEDFRNQMYVAGVLMNTRPNLERWLREPRAVNPQTAMPDLGVTEEDARQMAIFLLTVH